MIDSCRAHFSLFDASWIVEETGSIAIVEKDEGGCGEARFTSQNPCIVIRASKNAPLIWSLAQRKCADGAIVTFDANGAHLHVVELKSKVSLKTWLHVQHQLEGMYLTAMAVCRLVNITSFSSVTCYIAGTADKISDAANTIASPALLKSPVGKVGTFGGLEAWKAERVGLPFDVTAPVKKQWRDVGGNADFGII